MRKTILTRSIEIALYYADALVDHIDVDYYVRRMR